MMMMMVDDTRLQPQFTRTVEDVFPEVWNQEFTAHCVAFASAQFMTILNRIWKPAEYKDLIISPQQVINEHARTYKLLLPLLTHPKGLYNMARHPYLRVHDTPDKLDAETYGIKSLKFYKGTTEIEKQLVKNFRGGPEFPVFSNCHMFGLIDSKACRATPQNPYVRVCHLKSDVKTLKIMQ
ncbi:putative papain-like cysteine peptidase superfamily [Helianthus debilis subsp. tardiflorus]